MQKLHTEFAKFKNGLFKKNPALKQIKYSTNGFQLVLKDNYMHLGKKNLKN